MTTMSLDDEAPREIPSPHWVSRQAFSLLLITLALNQGALFFALFHNWMWLVIPLALVASHLMHGMLIAFHEASHGLLRKNRRINEIDGILLGVLSFMSFSLYRAAHQLHHAQLATERDEELWPFTHTDIPRWQRILAAALELCFGIFFTPFLFMRIFFRSGSPIRNTKLRRRIWLEIGLMALVWTAILVGNWLTGGWKYFIWTYAVPAVIAGNLQSWRKYIEHVGLTGCTVNGSTRSIVSRGPIGKFISLSLLHEPFHGVHHWRSGLPHPELPLHEEQLASTRPDEPGPFPSYGHAMIHLLRNLVDPRVGAQWLAKREAAQPEAAETTPSAAEGACS